MMAKIIPFKKPAPEITEQQKKDFQMFFEIGMVMVKTINEYLEEREKENDSSPSSKGKKRTKTNKGKRKN